MVTAYFVFLALLAGERLIETVVSRRNIAWALAQGGKEFGQRHFPAMVLLHVGLFAGCVVEAGWLGRSFIPAVGWPMLAVALAAQALRYWAIAALGRRWNVRIVVIPGAPVVTAGPYRWLRHPNYVAVVLEGLAVPLIHSAYLTAVAFTLLNAWLLWVRIRAEEAALSDGSDYATRFASRPRFWPVGGEASR